MAARIRDAMFSVFGEGVLVPINTNATAAEIIAWKQSQKTATCFANLYKIPKGEDVSPITRILEKVWPSTKPSEEQMAFAITVCQTILNPNNESILINASLIKSKVEKNKVSFKKLRSTQMNLTNNLF